MKSFISTFILLLIGGLFLAGCEQNPNSANEPGIRPMSQNPPPDAHPAIAYTASVRSGNSYYNTVSVMDSDGTDKTAIYTASASSYIIDVRPSWSPSGGSIAFVMHDPNSGIYPAIYLRDVTVSSGVASGSNTRSIYSTSAYSTVIRSASWSSVSTTAKVAFITRETGTYGVNKVLTVSTSGGTPAVLYQSNSSESRIYSSVTWSPDDSKIAFIDRAGSLSVANPDTIRVIDGSNGTLLESIAIGSTVGVTFIDWSRSGANTLAMTPKYGSGNVLYYVTPTTGSTPATNNVAGVSPSWSPNNSSVITSNAGTTLLQKTVTSAATTSTVATGAGYYGTWKR